jgi:hypothetical protein
MNRSFILRLMVGVAIAGCSAGTLNAAPETAHVMKPAVADPLVGDWQSPGGVNSPVAQISLLDDGRYQLNILRQFDTENNVVASMPGAAKGSQIVFPDVGAWNAQIDGDRLTIVQSGEKTELRKVNREPRSLRAPAPSGAVVLFDGKNFDAWTQKKGKEWLVADGPSHWKLVEGGAMEVVPGTDSLISQKQFGDCTVHVEFRTLGAPTNSGVYLQARYEVNINETYGRLDGTPSGGLDNSFPEKPKIRAARPPLAWQTLDIEFRAPRFDAAGKKQESAKATVFLNGVKLYDRAGLNPPKGAAGRLGEAERGPLMLQEHGSPVQFRNIWVVETPN